jgi:predicted negative regulator of RcsB-dependent stress response
VNRYTRKNLKKDQFAEQMSHGFEFLSLHKPEAGRYGGMALAVILIAAGIFYYMRHEGAVREAALADAVRIDNATVGAAPPQAGVTHYNTEDEKDKARAKAFSEVSAKYHGTQEGAIAEFYLASDAAEKGSLPEAEKRFKDIVDSAPSTYAALAKLALSKVYVAEGKDAEAEKVLRDLMAKPAISVSKEQAQIDLAILIGKKNPDEARKMLEPLRTERTAISRAAVQALGDLTPK